MPSEAVRMKIAVGKIRCTEPFERSLVCVCAVVRGPFFEYCGIELQAISTVQSAR
jgi:hypothetical protein